MAQNINQAAPYFDDFDASNSYQGTFNGNSYSGKRTYYPTVNSTRSSRQFGKHFFKENQS